MGGDATEEDDQTYEASQTFIAIGTQGGKVLVFNVLGLLIHEVTLSDPIVAVEWVGDMSAPSMLPHRVSSMSLESPPAVHFPVEEDDSPSDEAADTVRKKVVSHKHRQAPCRPISTGADLFSGDHNEPTSPQPTRKPSDVSTGSPLRVKRTRDRPLRPTQTRPRIVTETFRSPLAPHAGPSNSTPLTNPKPNLPAPVSSTQKCSTSNDTHNIPMPSLVGRCSASQSSSSLSSQESEFSDQEFFTAPSTQLDKGKAPAHLTSPQTSNTATFAPKPLVESASISSPTSLNNSSSLYSAPSSQAVRTVFERKPEDRSPFHTHRTGLVPRTPQRRVTIEVPDTPPSPDTPSSLYSRATSKLFNYTPASSSGDATGRRAWQRRGTIAPNDPHRQDTVEAPDTPQSFDSPTTLYSPPNPSILKSRLASAVHGTAATSSVAKAPQHRVPTNSSGTPTWLRSPVRVSSPPTPRMFRNTQSVSARGKTAATQRQNTLEADEMLPEFESPTTLYSPPTSGTFREVAKALSTHEELSFDGGVPEVLDVRGDWCKLTRRSTIGIGEEVRRLRDDNKVLRREIDALRGEFRALKDALLM